MASLDVNDVLMDPDLCSEFDVRRRAATTGGNGRTAITDEWHRGLYGFVKFSDGEMTRKPDGQIVDEEITVISSFALRDASFGFQPDVVLWRGGEYLVKRTTPARHFGRGFTKAYAVSTRAADAPAT